MHIDSAISKNVDLSVEEFVQIFENKFTKIELEACDYSTSLFKKYDCHPVNWKYRKKLNQEITLNARNENVINEILKNEHSKIAVIYGASHVEGIVELLKQNGFQSINEK